MQAQKAKHWCFTINNPTLEERMPGPELFEYMVLGHEVGKENGTPHIQGYVCMKKQTTRVSMSKMFPRANLSVMYKDSNPKAASDYCKKDGKFQEFGTLPKWKNSDTTAATKKRKADYELAYDLAKKNKLHEIDKGVLIRHMSSLKQIARDHPPQLETNDDLCGVWFYGPPGCGKSRSARWLYPNAYPKPCNKWWDGYQNQDYVIIDDFDRNHVVLGHHLKIWADHYPFIAEQKGHSITIRPKVLCITSNYHPAWIFTEDKTLYEAIKRRFIIKEFTFDLYEGMKDNKTCSTYQFMGQF